MKRYPEPIVGSFIRNPRGELLLFRTHKWKGMYCVPGGHVEWGETIEAALRREVKEETGLDVGGYSLLCIWDFISEPEFWKPAHMIFLNYLVHSDSDAVTLNDEAEEYVWVTPDQALALPLEKYTRLTIEQHLPR